MATVAATKPNKQRYTIIAFLFFPRGLLSRFVKHYTYRVCGVSSYGMKAVKAQNVVVLRGAGDGRVAHPCDIPGCGFSDPRLSLSRWPIPICPCFARGVYRTEEKSRSLRRNREECGT